MGASMPARIVDRAPARRGSWARGGRERAGADPRRASRARWNPPREPGGLAKERLKSAQPVARAAAGSVDADRPQRILTHADEPGRGAGREQRVGGGLVKVDDDDIATVAGALEPHPPARLRRL